MAETTGIGWTDATWNPWIGCSPVNACCDNCYMFTGMRQYGRNPEIVQRTSPRTFNMPLRLKESKLIFTCSWSDFFHKDADQWREEAWEIILRTPHLTYQILTKRPGRAVAWSLTHPFPDNVWIGTSVGQKKYLPWLDVLARIEAKVRFVSLEPLLEQLDIQPWLPTLDWVIDGGESGPGRRPADPQWFRDIRDQCLAAGVPFFHKQGNDRKSGQDRLLDGRTWEEFPEFRVREGEMTVTFCPTLNPA